MDIYLGTCFVIFVCTIKLNGHGFKRDEGVHGWSGGKKCYI